jgi:hypothetical protein
MAVTYYAILTTIGASKLANAAALGTTLKITQMAVGDGNGNVPTPDASRTSLVREVRRAPLNRLSIDPANAAQIIAEQVIPESVGGWWIREIGLYDDAGSLVAIANCAPSYKPQLAEGSGRTQTVRMILIVNNTGTVELKIDPSVVLATREYVDSAITAAMNRQDIKKSVRVATTNNITLTNAQTVDGVALVVGDRVLVKNQTTGSQNGIYTVATGAWIRAEDADESAEVTPGLTVPVESGTQNADTVWLLITDAPIVLGTTALTFQDITNGLARLQSPAFTGSPTGPTPAAASSDASLATTAFVRAAMALFGVGITSNGPTMADFDDLTIPSGMYFTDGSSVLNPPPNSGGGQGFVLHKIYGAGGFQLYSRFGTADVLYRSRAGTWSAWRQIGMEANRRIGLGDVDAVTIADVNDATVGSGIYYTSSSDANRPLSANGVLLHKVAGVTGFQLFQPSGLDRLMYRRRAGSAWLAWRDIDPATYGLGSSQNQPNWPNTTLNDCTGVLSGIYRTISSTTGLPASADTTSVVKFWFRDAVTTGVYQVVQELINATTGKRYTRTAPSNGTAAAPNWSAWREEAYTDSPAFSGNPTAPTAAQFDTDTSIATTEFVQRALGSFSGYVNYSASGTLTAADAGKYIIFGLAANGTCTLPNPSTLPSGTTFTIEVTGGVLTVTATGATSSTFSGPSMQAPAASYPLPDLGVTQFVVVAGQYRVSLGAGKAAISASGYQKLPSGLIIQWGLFPIGYGSTASSSGTAISNNFPIAFPNACLSAVMTHNGGVAITITVNGFTKTKFDAWSNYGQSGASGWLIAIGY